MKCLLWVLLKLIWLLRWVRLHVFPQARTISPSRHGTYPNYHVLPAETKLSVNLEPSGGGLRPTTGMSYAGVGSLRSGTGPLPNVRGYDVVTQENAGADAVLGAAAALAGGQIGAAVGLLGQATAFLDSMAGPSTQKFEVNKDNILKAGRIIQDQADRLRDGLKEATRVLRIPADEDTDGRVGANIASAWNSRLIGHDDTYAGRVAGYIASLEGLSAQLREASTQYGLSEEDITATFGPIA